MHDELCPMLAVEGPDLDNLVSQAGGIQQLLHVGLSANLLLGADRREDALAIGVVLLALESRSLALLTQLIQMLGLCGLHRVLIAHGQDLDLGLIQRLTMDRDQLPGDRALGIGLAFLL